MLGSIFHNKYMHQSLQVHSINTVLFRAATIRDCNEAEVELREQIKEARQDLTKKGFKWR